MIRKLYVQIPELSGKAKRCVYLYLPASYGKNTETRYPVMYMFDGHNVFYDRDATFGRSWRMAEYLQRSKKQLIIVAVECNHEGNRRLEEYCPFDFMLNDTQHIRGEGEVYMHWLTETLKPFIDTHYRTLPDRAHTLICGASMGGLMALYGACAYGHIFGRAACLSPSLWLHSERALSIIEDADMARNTCIYIDYGSEELGNHAATADALSRTTQLLMQKGVSFTLRIIPGGTHCEASWEKQIPIFMECLGV